MFGNRSLISYGLCALYRVFLAYLYISIDIMAVTAVGCSASETKVKTFLRVRDTLIFQPSAVGSRSIYNCLAPALTEQF